MNFIEALRKTAESIRDWVKSIKTSWNDLTDKPFEETEQSCFSLLTLDPNVSVSDQDFDGWTKQQTNMSEYTYTTTLENLDQAWLSENLGALVGTYVKFFVNGEYELVPITESNVAADSVTVSHRSAKLTVTSEGNVSVVVYSAMYNSHLPMYYPAEVVFIDIKPLDPKYLPSGVVTGTIQWPEDEESDYAPIINIDKSATEIADMLKAGTLLFFRDHSEYSDSYYPITYSSFYSETEFECGFEVISTQNGLECYSVWLWTDNGSVNGEVGYRNIAENILPDMDNIMLTSPNGTQYKLTVSDDGMLSAVEATPM